MFTPDTAIGEFVPYSSHVATSVVKTTGGDYMLIWHLEGLPFVGREEWELEHKHNTFNRMLQTLRAPDFVNVAFWVHAAASARIASSSIASTRSCPTATSGSCLRRRSCGTSCT